MDMDPTALVTEETFSAFKLQANLKSDEPVAKVVGLFTAHVYDIHCRQHTLQPSKADKAAILRQIRQAVEKILTSKKPTDAKSCQVYQAKPGKPEREAEVRNRNTDFCRELSQQLDQLAVEDSREGKEHKYPDLWFPKSKYTPVQRIHITLLAEQRGLATFEALDAQEQLCLVVSKSRSPERKMHVADLRPEDLVSFSNLVSPAFTSSDHKTLLDDVHLFDKHAEWASFLDEIQRYGPAGFRRRNVVIEEVIVTDLAAMWPLLPLERLKSKELAQHIAKEMGAHGGFGGFGAMRKLYRPEHDAQLFVSLDFREANFQAYRRLGLFADFANWQQFLQQYTRSPLLLNSKRFRIEVLGKADKSYGVQSAAIAEMLLELWTPHRDEFKSQLVAMMGDELVLRADSDSWKMLVDALERWPKHASVTTRVSCYRLHYSSQVNCYAKSFLYPKDKPFEIKCVPDNTHRQCQLYFQKLGL